MPTGRLNFNYGWCRTQEIRYIYKQVNACSRNFYSQTAFSLHLDDMLFCVVIGGSCFHLQERSCCN